MSAATAKETGKGRGTAGGKGKRKARGNANENAGVDGRVKLRLLFVDEGSYHHEEVTVAESLLGRYERLIDCLREEPDVLRELYVDVGRLCSAYRVTGEE